MNFIRIIAAGIIFGACSNFLGFAENLSQIVSGEPSTAKRDMVLNLPDDIIQPGDGDWKEMYFRAIRINDKVMHFIVSSELESVDPFEGLGKYGGHNLFDDDPATAWVEGAGGKGTGEYVIFRTDEYYPKAVTIQNGYQKSERLFMMNNRPQKLWISLYAGFYLEGDDSEIASRYRIKQITGAKVIELVDKMGSQRIEIPFDLKMVMQLKDSLTILFNKDFREEMEQRKKLCRSCDMIPHFSFFVRLEISDVYTGSEWDDTCISGLSFENMPIFTGERVIGENEEIGEVYEDEDIDAGKIYFDTDRNKKILLVDKTKLEEYKYLDDNLHLSISLMDVSPDKEWAQVDLMIYEKGAGRVEEYSALFNIRLNRRVSDSLLKTIYGVFGFVEDDGKIWLDTADGYIDLDKIREAMKVKK